MAQGQFLNRTGDPGKPGLDGDDGAQWLADIGEPDASIGEPGDFYIDRKTADVYRKIKKTWTLMLNIQGPRGKKGKDGEDGKDAEIPKPNRHAASGGGFQVPPAFPKPKIVTIDSEIVSEYVVKDVDRVLRVIGTKPVLIWLPDPLTFGEILKIKNCSSADVTIKQDGGFINDLIELIIRKRTVGLGNAAELFPDGGQFWES